MLDLKNFSIQQLEKLCADIREDIIKTVNLNGGHLASNLGVVELTVALSYVYNFETDRLVFDVGHQAYAYKILTDRAKDIFTIRREGGISGFADPDESAYDCFLTGHAGTSISAALGLAYARDRQSEKYNVISMVGDASFFNGENLEALTCSTFKPKHFLVVLNDNGKSITRNNNGLYKAISSLTLKKSYLRVNEFLSGSIGKSFIGKGLKKIKVGIKRLLSYYTLFDRLGLKYVGPFDGHNLKALIKILERIRDSGQPTILHVRTVKGKGFEMAEKDSTTFHGIGANFKPSVNSFSESVSGYLDALIQRHEGIVALTAGMCTGVGLTGFAESHPEAYVDVGIAEDYAVTFAGGVARGGGIPIVFIYSTFMQRAFDQILNDICLQNLHVVFCLDRAGVAGSDGKTHQGIYDLSYLGNLPNMTVFAPKDVAEFGRMLEAAVTAQGPVAIRYPSGVCEDFGMPDEEDVHKWQTVREGTDCCILAVGSRLLKEACIAADRARTSVAVVNARCVKPLDEEMLSRISGMKIITLEENVEGGGFGAQVLRYYARKNIAADVTVAGVKQEILSHASVQSQLESNGLTAEHILSLTE